MTADKDEERTRYQKDLILAFKYIIAYNELVANDETARREWLQKGLTLFPQDKELLKIAASDTAQK